MAFAERIIMNKLSTLAVAVALLAAVFAPCASVAGPFIYVANAGDDTVSKIDINWNTEVARYATWFNTGTNNLIATQSGNAWAGPAPSRIARDSAGNAYVLDRFFSSGTGCAGHTWPNNSPHRPVLLKIAPSAGSPTSVGSVLSITDTNNNDDIDSGEAADKAILWAKPVGQPTDNIGVGRALAVDTTGNLWVGMYCTKQYYKVDANTGNMIPPAGNPVPTGAHTPYGCAVDLNGKLWSVDEKNTLAEIDTISNTFVGVKPHSGVNYSLSIFNDCSSSPPTVKVYISNRDDDTGNTGKTYIVYDPQTGTFTNAPLSSNYLFASVAIGVDSHGDIVSGKWNGIDGGRVIKTSPSGAVKWDTKALGTTVSTSDLRGIIIDANDDVWAVHRVGNRVVKYSGANGAKLAAITIGDSPYTYGNVPPPTCNGTATPTPTPTPTATPTPCAQVTGEARCLPNGGYSYTFSVTNNSSSVMSQILLTPVQGSTFTLTPQLTNLPTPLQNGQSTTLMTNIDNVKPGDKVCFFVSLMSEKTQCCIVQVCPALPRCGVIETATPPPPTRQQRPPPPSRRGKRRP
jgi:hypothetical protein